MTRKMNYTVWTVQWVLALLFLFAGSMKLLLPIAEMTKQMPFPGMLLRFIGAMEVLGAAGLILPGLLGIRRELTPLAAAGLVIIMVGATTLMLTSMGAGAAVMPFVVGLLAGFVAWKRYGNFKREGRDQCWLPSRS